MNRKAIIPVVLFIFGLLISWGIWITTGSFDARAERETIGGCIQNIQEAQRELKEGQKELQNDIKENRETIHNNQQAILRLLLEISRDIKRNNKDFGIE